MSSVGLTWIKLPKKAGGRGKAKRENSARHDLYPPDHAMPPRSQAPSHVTQREYELPDGVTLVSTTDPQGRITHCNREFVEASGFDYDELLGQPHHIVRHPDMPPEAFADMWATIGRGRPWSGLVKNRRKDGDHYWVQANVSPVMKNGKPAAYMSVRLKPSREQVAAAEALYGKLAQERATGHQTFRIHAGGVRPVGWRDWLGRLHRLSLGQRLTMALLACLALGMAPVAWPGMLGWSAMGWPVWSLQLLLLALGGGAVMAWLNRTVLHELSLADEMACNVAGCNLTGAMTYKTTSPLGSLMRRLWLINLNMRAIVADVRGEVDGMVDKAQGIYQGSQELARRTESQASGVEETSASVEEVSATIRQTVDRVNEAAQLGHDASAEASKGGVAVDAVSRSMHEIQSSSQRITAIIEVMESLAFQTNLLALNAAVEAAHAGEQGRGFAVVAGEVRLLAQRSTQAAHEIRDLIQASVAEVNQGTSTVDHAAATIRQAVGSVEKVSAVLQHITNAAGEQAQGMAQINEAMQLLDGVTQENAQQADASARACQELERKADTLQRAVQIFQLAS